jgi:hypothetical protein
MFVENVFDLDVNALPLLNIHASFPISYNQILLPTTPSLKQINESQNKT